MVSAFLEFGYRDDGLVWGLKTVCIEGTFLLVHRKKSLLSKVFFK